MLLSLIKKDLKRNKAINMVLILFLILSACLLSSAALITCRLLGSIDNIYKIAKPPHFLQMHKGEYSQEEIDRFVKSMENIEDEVTVEMLDIEGGAIWITPKNAEKKSYSLSDSVIENCFVIQNEKYDLLLNMNNERAEVEQGEIGVPVIYAKKYDLQIGDTLSIVEGNLKKDFKITTFIRDAQMNSSMVSSTRFLVNLEDKKVLEEYIGEKEYIIEFFFKDQSKADNFQTIYEDAGLPINGPAITYQQMKLLSSFSDMAMVLIIILASVLLSFIAILCLRFTILAAIKEEIKEIGAMEAIGISFKDISTLYLTKYKCLITVGMMLGYSSSLAVSKLFTKHIVSTFGEGNTTYIEVILPIVVVSLNGMLIIKSCKKVLRELKRMSVVEALMGESDAKKGRDKKFKNQRMKLEKCKKLSVNSFYAVREIWLNSKKWRLMFFIIAIAAFIMIIPTQLYTTISAPKFATYMGSPQCDICIELQTAKASQEKAALINEALRKDEEILEFDQYVTYRYRALNQDNEWTNVYTMCGAVEKLDIAYISGKAPENTNEIALSLMNAREMGKEQGDVLLLEREGKLEEVKISGIYQDVTSGGYTAKMPGTYNEQNAVSYSYFINVNKGVSVDDKVKQYEGAIPAEAKMRPMKEFVQQTMGGTLGGLKNSVILVVFIAEAIVALITILFLKMNLVKDYSSIAAMKAVGFETADIRKQYFIKVGLTAVLGVVVGIIFSYIGGQALVNMILVISGIGIEKITFISNPVIIYLIYPVILLGAVMLAAWHSTKAVKKYNIVELINE